MKLPTATEAFPVGQEATIVAWHESPVLSRMHGLMHRCVLTLRAADSGHGMLPAFDVQHSEFRSPRDDLHRTVEAPLAVGMLTRWSKFERYNPVIPDGRAYKRSLYFAHRLPISPNG